MEEPGDEQGEHHAGEEEVEEAVAVPEAPPGFIGESRRGGGAGFVPVVDELGLPRSGDILRDRTADLTGSGKKLAEDHDSRKLPEKEPGSGERYDRSDL